MRIAVVGCGAIGGILAARLARAGADVTPVTGNDAIAQAIARDGLRVMELDGSAWSVAPPRPAVVRLAPGDGPFDLCVLATKATVMETALRETAPALAPGATVVACQNGLPEDLAARVVGRERVLGCVVAFGASMTAPGVFERTSDGGLQLGRPWPEAPDPEPARRTLERAAPVTIVPDLTAVRWSKLSLNCATSTLGAIGGERLGVLLARRHVRRLVLEMWTEIVHVARAWDVRMAPIGGTLDVERMALTPAEQASAVGSPALAVKHSVLLAVGMRYRRMRSSMLNAIERGRTPEIAFLNGEVVRRGAERHVDTPINARLVSAVETVASGRVRPSMAFLKSVYREIMDARAATLAA